MTAKSYFIGMSYRRFITLFVLLITSAVCTSMPASAQVQAFPNEDNAQIAVHTLRAKAPADECFAFISNPSPLPTFTDPTRCSSYPTPPGMPVAKPKVNQSYVWGLTESGDDVWWGTFANANCLTQAGSVPSTPNPNGAPNSHMTDSWVCEYYDSPYYPSVLPDARIGDFRPPRFYSYAKSTQTLVDRTPKYPAYVNPTTNPTGIYNFINITRGIRSATTYNGLIIMAGPALTPASLVLFAWNASTNEFLGGRILIGYNNIRSFRILDGVLYTAVGKNSCSSPTSCTPTIIGGRILRLNPNIIPGCTFSPTPQVLNPPPCWNINDATQTPTEVGNLDTVAGSLAIHNGRIYTVTWPSQFLPGVLSSLYMSPAIPAGGLTAANADQWTQLWKASDYEPDPIMVQFYSGGALASFDGYLWWGTLHIAMEPFVALAKTFPPTTQEEAVQDLAGTMRAAVFFRGKDLDTPNPKIDLVYGNEQLPVFTPPANGNPQSWVLQTNKMPNPKSLWGPSGFGNMWNTYIWSANVWNNRLWIGTMDWSFSSQQVTNVLTGVAGAKFPEEFYASANYGGDLFYITEAGKPAFPESTNGVDNPTTFGIRNQIVSSNGNAFLGMANASNLATDPTDPKHIGGLGGWELIELSPSPNVNTPVGTNVTVYLANNSTVNFCNVTLAGTTFATSVKNPYRGTVPVSDLLEPFELNGPPLPPGIGSQPSEVVLLWSSAVWGKGCSSPTLATVNVRIPGDVTSPRLLQLYWDGAQYLWKDITTNVSLGTGRIEGAVTSDYLGILGVAPASAASLNALIQNKGVANGSYYVDLRLTNTGTTLAYNVSLEQLTFRTLAGSGTLSYNPSLSAPLPRSLGNLAPGASVVVRLYLKPTTSIGGTGVTRFYISEDIRTQNAAGTSFVETYTQLVVP